MQISQFNLHDWKFDKFPEGVILIIKSDKEEISFEATPTNEHLLVKYSIFGKKNENHYSQKMKIRDIALKLGFGLNTQILRESLDYRKHKNSKRKQASITKSADK